MKNLFIFTLTTLILIGCSIIEINGNGYNSLRYFEKEHVESFEQSKQYDPKNNSDCFKIFEINSENLKTIIDSNAYTWIHIWNPYCGNENCINIGQFEVLQNKYKDFGMNLTFISSTYDLDHVLSRVKRSNFSEKVYVL